MPDFTVRRGSAESTLMLVENLRSPKKKVGGIVYFGRMLDKIRLQAGEKLPADYVQNLGAGFDGRCVRFLHVTYEQVQGEVKPGVSDEDILEKCFQLGRKPSEEEIEIWNDFMRKRGWNDEATELVARRKLESNLQYLNDVVTMFDYIDADEEKFYKGRSQGRA